MKLLAIFRNTAAWLGGREPVVLGVLLAIVFAAWGFAEIADEVVEGETQTLDARVVQAMRQPNDPTVAIGPDWVQEMGRDTTAFGGIPALLLFTFGVAGYLLLDGKYKSTLFLLAAVGSGIALSFGLKTLFGRPRPSVVPHLSIVHTSSFPSGHAMLSAVVYLTLGALLAASLRSRRLKAYVLAVAVLLSLAVGVSRVYLGVHYPTDVLAGWMAGLVWALLCWLIGHWMLRRTEKRDVNSHAAPPAVENDK